MPADLPPLGDDTQHVYPLNDITEHETDGTPCWCNPVIQVAEGGRIVIHNAADGREQKLGLWTAN